MGYGPWGCKELDTTEQLTVSLSLSKHKAVRAFTSRTLGAERQGYSSEHTASFGGVYTIAPGAAKICLGVGSGERKQTKNPLKYCNNLRPSKGHLM